MSSGPFQLGQADMALWLAQPASKLFMEWLKGQVSLYQQKIPVLIAQEALSQARTATGALRAYEEILGTFEGTEDKPIEPEEPFTDPAERYSLRRRATR